MLVDWRVIETIKEKNCFFFKHHPLQGANKKTDGLFIYLNLAKPLKYIQRPPCFDWESSWKPLEKMCLFFYVPPWTLKIILLPIASMYGIFTYSYHKNQPFI